MTLVNLWPTAGWRRLFYAPIAASTAVIMAAGCATTPETYRLEAEIADLLGFPMAATAVRGPSTWTIDRRVYAYGQTQRIRLSRAESLALDEAVADPALYAPPTPRQVEHCIDPASIRLDVIANKSSRRLTLNCETSPGMAAVLRILFDWPEGDD